MCNRIWPCGMQCICSWPPIHSSHTCCGRESHRMELQSKKGIELIWKWTGNQITQVILSMIEEVWFVVTQPHSALPHHAHTQVPLRHSLWHITCIAHLWFLTTKPRQTPQQPTNCFSRGTKRHKMAPLAFLLIWYQGSISPILSNKRSHVGEVMWLQGCLFLSYLYCLCVWSSRRDISSSSDSFILQGETRIKKEAFSL